MSSKYQVLLFYSYSRIIDPIKAINKFFSNFENIHLCDVLIICVPTPLKNKSPNLEFIKNTVSTVSNTHLRAHET